MAETHCISYPRPSRGPRDPSNKMGMHPLTRLASSANGGTSKCVKLSPKTCMQTHAYLCFPLFSSLRIRIGPDPCFNMFKTIFNPLWFKLPPLGSPLKVYGVSSFQQSWKWTEGVPKRKVGFQTLLSASVMVGGGTLVPT